MTTLGPLPEQGGRDNMQTATATKAPVPFYRPAHAFITIKVNCGCGARFGTIEDGEAHAVTTSHTLHIAGEIRSNR